LIVIGAPKCGTTALHYYLGLHPEIAMADAKELDFFIAHQNWKRGLSWYESQFRPAPVRGESSPTYSAYPMFPGVPERMASVVPDTRLVYLVRDPIERAISAYRFRRWVMGSKNFGDINERLTSAAGDQAILTGCYALQLEQYLAFFPQEQIMVVDSADLRARKGQTLARIFAFLGVDDGFTTDEFSRPIGETDGLQANVVGRAVRSTAFQTIGKYRAQALKAKVPRPLQRVLLSHQDMPQVTLTPDVREMLEARFKEDVVRLRALTGQRFESWSV
jgi:hypothetical protein